MSSVRSQPEIERTHVDRLLTALGRRSVLKSLDPPAPDVRAMEDGGAVELFEVTEIHWDETSHGSATRAEEEKLARLDPHAIVSRWVLADAMPAIRRRVDRKIQKAAGYVVKPNEVLSLLLVGSVPKLGAVTATHVFAPLLSIENLNAEFHEPLRSSRFQRACLYLPLSGGPIWEWRRLAGWAVLRPPDDISREGRETLQMLRESSSGGILPGTKLWR